MALGAAWAAFAHWIAPGIIVVPNRLCRSTGDLPIGYLNCWEVLAGAMQIALILHFIIVLLVRSIGRKHKGRYPESTNANERAVDILLIAFSAAFLSVTAITGILADYDAYVILWTSILNERNPWSWNFTGYELINAYGPLFNVLAPMISFNPLFNKLLFAFSYLLYIIWLIKKHGPRCGFDALSYPCFGLLLFNLFPWVQIAYLGYFDVLVGLACVASVHSLVRQKDSVSGTYLALGILLKFMPIVILPFLAFHGRRFHFRLVGYCVAVVAVGFFVSIVIWGTSTFAPLAFAATRSSFWSIYDVMNSTHSPLRAIWDTPHAEVLEKPLLLTAGSLLFAWCAFRQIEPSLSATVAILVTMLFYRVSFVNYHMVFLCLVYYWTVSQWHWFSRKIGWSTVLICYFNFLALAGIYYIRHIPYSPLVIDLLQFVLDCAMMAGLLWFSTLSAGQYGTPARGGPSNRAR